MIGQYFKFFINGGVIGVVAVGLQSLIYVVIGKDTSVAYAFASAATYGFLVVINYNVQKRWIFRESGAFSRFVLANLAIMFLVSFLSPLCRFLIDINLVGQWGDRAGFLVAALIGSVPSFVLQKYWVFRG